MIRLSNTLKRLMKVGAILFGGRDPVHGTHL